MDLNEHDLGFLKNTSKHVQLLVCQLNCLYVKSSKLMLVLGAWVLDHKIKIYKLTQRISTYRCCGKV